MRTIVHIFFRWLMEISCVYGAFIVASVVAEELGYIDVPILPWLPKFYAYLKLSALVAIPWGIYFRARELKEDNGRCEAVLSIAVLIHIFSGVLIFGNLEKYADGQHFYGALSDWAPYLSSLTPLLYCFLSFLWRLCKSLDKIDRDTPKANRKSVEVALFSELPKLAAALARTIDAVTAIQQNFAEVEKKTNEIRKAVEKLEKKKKAKKKGSEKKHSEKKHKKYSPND